MKIVVFGDQHRVGALLNERILDLNRADAALPSNLRAFIEAGQPALDAAQRAIDRAPELALLDTAGVKLHAPWPERRIACVGGNYADHLQGMGTGEYAGRSIEDITSSVRGAGQWGFWKVPDDVTGPDADVAYPKRTEYFDYEGEAAIIIGKRGKDISAGAIDDYVWGVTLLNDISIRDGMSGPRPMSYNLPKNFDGSTAMGPCIVVGELSAQNVDVETCVNGQLRQHYNTRDMIFSFGEVLEYLSRDFTFVPGDVIAGGTAAGTAADRTKRRPDGTRPKDFFLKVGDVVEISSPQIGVLRNTIV